MKIATVFYDKNGTLVKPPLFWNKPHPTSSTLSLEGGYWHLTEKDFSAGKLPDGRDANGRVCDSALVTAMADRDFSMEKAIQLIPPSGGTVLDVTPVTLMSCLDGSLIRPTPEQIAARRPGEDIIYRWRMLYIIEEPGMGPFIRYAARDDRMGVDPDFVYPYDGVAEQGPDYRTPRSEQLAYRAAYLAESVQDQFPLDGLRGSHPEPETFPDYDNGY